ncbi:MAG TPA: GNAT family N-acetyltransferase, partial [Flavihumibacter sp.]|nr:GNAT family N-acetyltransferase [Flavihumibacter sp.]
MLYDPKDHYKPEETAKDFKEHSKGYERLLRFKQFLFGDFFGKKLDASATGNGDSSKKKLHSLFHHIFHF